MKGILFLLLHTLLIVRSLAQPAQTTETRLLTVQPHQAVAIRYNQPYSSALLRLPAGTVLTDTYLVAGADTLLLHPDPHPAEQGPSTVLCVFRKPVSQLTLLTGGLSGTLSLLSLYVPPLPAGYVAGAIRSAARQADACARPVVVPVSVWRKGLVPPKEPPRAS